MKTNSPIISKYNKNKSYSRLTEYHFVWPRPNELWFRIAMLGFCWRKKGVQHIGVQLRSGQLYVSSCCCCCAAVMHQLFNVSLQLEGGRANTAVLLLQSS